MNAPEFSQQIGTKRVLKIGVVEDNDSTREDILRQNKEMEDVICETAHRTTSSALEDAKMLSVDLLILDIHLPGSKSGVELLRELRRLGCKPVVIMHTAMEDDRTLFDALQAGASGYLVKGTSREALAAAIRDAWEGGMPLSRAVARRVLGFFHRASGKSEGFDQLTKRENEVLKDLATGYMYKEIAQRLDIKHETVKAHVASIYGKLHVRTRTEAVVKYYEGPGRWTRST